MSVLVRHRATVLLLAAAAVAWVITYERMIGMDEGPFTHLGGLVWYLWIWVTMTAAMMLPSTAPVAERVARLLPTLGFVAGYLAVWTVFGLPAYGIFRLVTSLEGGVFAWDDAGPYVAGGVLVAAGLYELTPLKRRSLRRCRHPEQEVGALRSGLVHGVDCVGSSGGLMVALFALGVMSLFWMALVAAAIFAEKVLPRGVGLSRVVAVALVVLGIWVAASPGSVPGLTEPGGGSPSMEMDGSVR